MNNIQKDKSKKEYIGRINRVIDYIKQDLEGELSLERLSSVANFSKFYFHRIFKSIAGETLNSYVARIRLEKSTFLLQFHPDKTITSIAYESGFSSPAVYNRTFKSHYNLTPSQWRENKVENKSKNGKLLSNMGQHENNQCKNSIEISMYIDPRTKQPKWRINMHDNKTLDIQVKNMPEMNVAYIRHHGNYDPQDKKLFQALFSQLMTWAIPRGLFTPPDTKAMTIYSSGHPETTEPENLSVDVCISINKNTKVNGDVGKRLIPGGQYAFFQLKEATTDDCTKAWDEMFNHWLPQSGYQPSDGAYYCNHLNDPEQHPQKLYDIEMYLPVKPL